MIDVHCHLEQKDFDADRKETIKKCRNELKAVVTCCAHPRDFDQTMKMVRENPGFVYASVGIHPEYVKEIPKAEQESFMEKIRKNREHIIAIGETGLDYHWIKEDEWRNRQKGLFMEMIELSKDMDLPVVVHSRDAMADTVKILETCDAGRVLLHLFGAKDFMPVVIENKWNISIGPLIKQSKVHRKIARDMPIERIMLETDSPWFGFGSRSDPTHIKFAAEKIAEAKHMEFETVWNKCGDNAKKFFGI